jgi:endonuclease/exonuclease/phosphatase family metal-dependent hydrolase
MNKHLSYCLIVITLLVGSTMHTHPLRAQTVNSSKAFVPIKVMSFNIRQGAANDGSNHWDLRSQLVTETIRMFDPDLLGTQEVLQFQAEFLQSQLPGYGFHGVGRNDGATKGEYVPIMYKKDRFQLMDAGHFWLSETPKIAGSRSWDSSYPRMVSWVELIDLRNNESPLVFMNTHFDHRGKTARLESARLIRKHAEEVMVKQTPIIIAGDFNTTEDLQPYAVLTSGSESNKTPLIDSYRQANPKRDPNESTGSRWNGRREGSRIDWILHSREFTTLQAAINRTNDEGRFPSDHYPVQAILRLKK